MKSVLTKTIHLQPVDDRRNFLTVCGLENVCNLVQLDKPLNQFIISLLAQLIKTYIKIGSTKKMALIVLLEFINKIDSNLSIDDNKFIDYIISKITNSIL
ncbi:hypothetical protein [Okeania sp. SIO3I5]|uniref:hypothetical protein n=1 Tax=Okeania sp. SIO3I5 TaxID=2607805 RepID=UPI00343273AF